MMISKFMAELKNLGVEVRVQDDRLVCNAPKGVLTSDLRDTISEHKKEIISILKQGQSDGFKPVPQIEPVSRDIKPPLSYAQQRLWYLDQLEPNKAVYNLPMAFRLKGSLDNSVLEKSINEIIRRHEALRTTIGMENDMPVQVISPDLEIKLHVLDFTGHQYSNREDELKRFLSAESMRSFNLSEGPLIRFCLIRMDDLEHVLFVMPHHFVFDGWSIDVFLRELFDVYKAFLAGKPSPLPGLPIQYADFVVWQRKWLESGELERQLVYWREQLRGEIPVLQMPTDRPHPATQSYIGSIETLIAPKPLADELINLGRSEGCTLFMVLLAAFNTLLYRYTGQNDIIVGSPIANRTRPETEGLIGFFANTLVLRTNFEGDPSFRLLLHRVRETCLGAYGNQDTPFERLVEELKPKRDLSRTPIFQALFAFQDETSLISEVSGVSITPVHLDMKVSRTDMSFWVIKNKNSITGDLEYSSDLFNRETIVRFLKHLKLLFQSIVKDPDTAVDRLILLSEDERQKMLVDWNATQTEFPEHSCIHELVEAQAELNPDKVAYIYRDTSLTYCRLNQHSNQVANYLRSQGVGPDVMVGICMDRCLEMIIGLLGILKAGGAYVPLDPVFPLKRLEYMIKDAGISKLITTKDLMGKFPGNNADFICLDSDWDKISGQDDKNPVSLAMPENIAYVIYTSGSTGMPKGVKISHSSAVNFLSSMQKKPGLTKNDVLLAITTISFDISVLELFLPLISGAQTVLAGREDASDPAKLIEILKKSGITVMQATPTTWRMLILAGWRGADGLKVLCGGEALPMDLSKEIIKYSGSLWNMYGPTETTVWSSCFNMTDPEDNLIIGMPIDNTRMYILNGQMQPAPAGVLGELYIGGTGVSCGYLNQPELTAACFVADPFSKDPKSRLYKTGDMARYRTDGNIQYINRIDSQVKIRGFRIELGEIEAALGNITSVKEAVVTAYVDAHGEKSLAAYIISNGERPSINLIRDSLKNRLPDYMIPKGFIFLDEFPLTPNLKVDRKALPPVDIMQNSSSNVFVAPRDSLELQLKNTWEKNLGVNPIGLRDNYFDLGGNSMNAVRLFIDMEKLTGIKLPLATLFNAQTIEQMADIYRKDSWSPSWSSLVPIQEGGSKPPLYLIHGAGGNVLLYRDLAKHLGPDQPVYGLQSQGLDGKEEFYTRIEDMAAHYVAEIINFQTHGPYYLGGYCMGGQIAYEMARQLDDMGQKTALVALLDTQRQWKPVNIPILIYQKYQQIAFHVKNLLMSDYKGMAAFLREKALESGRRLRRLLDVIKSHLCFKLGLRKERPLHIMEKINDNASFEYIPRPYKGLVTLFSPRQAYAGYSDPLMGWGDISTGGVDLQELSVYPAGMLVEPFVAELADKLKICIEKASMNS